VQLEVFVRLFQAHLLRATPPVVVARLLPDTTRIKTHIHVVAATMNWEGNVYGYVEALAAGTRKLEIARNALLEVTVKILLTLRCFAHLIKFILDIGS